MKPQVFKIPKHLTIAIVGSGPSAFYTADRLLKKNDQIRVSIFEKLPFPFGLVRYGVAPDHQSVKNCTDHFFEILKNDRVSYFGNVQVGRDVSLLLLRMFFSGVVLAHGASADKYLGIPGENGKNVYSSREIVDWYNGLSPNNLKLDNIKKVLVIGNGNVALDIARVLVSPLERLETTDISTRALKTLAKSSINEIQIIGRRGPMQSSFSTAELREILGLVKHGINLQLDPELLCEAEGLALDRKTARLLDVMKQISATNTLSSRKTIKFKYLKSPRRIVLREDGSVKGLELTINRMQDGKCKSTDQQEIIECDAIVKAIGYTQQQLEGLPFDSTKDAVPNENGRVIDVSGQHQNVMNGLYVSGWAKTGPRGVIASTLVEAKSTADVILQDIENQKLKKRMEFNFKLPFAISATKVAEMNLKEIKRGATLGKIREKMTIDEMLKV